ncbi:hypothetical protein KEM55_009284, partial [Ascosphaera atra]
MGEKFRSKPDAKGSDVDEVRQWFIRDTWRTENIIPWILNGIKTDQKQGLKLNQEFATQLREATDLSLATLSTAFKFRDENLSLYCEEGYFNPIATEHTPEPWTSLAVNFEETERLLDLALNACIKWRNRNSQSSVSEADMATIKTNLPRLFRVHARMATERNEWCSKQSDSGVRDAGKLLYGSYIKERRLQLYKLGGIGLLEESRKLAEDFQDMEAL